MTDFTARLREFAEEMTRDGDDYVEDYGRRLRKMLQGAVPVRGPHNGNATIRPPRTPRRPSPRLLSGSVMPPRGQASRGRRPFPGHGPFPVAGFPAPGGTGAVLVLGGYRGRGASPGTPLPELGRQGHVGEVFLPPCSFPCHDATVRSRPAP